MRLLNILNFTGNCEFSQSQQKIRKAYFPSLMCVFKSSYRNLTVLRIILLSLVLIYSEFKKERLRCYYIEWVDSTILVLQYVFCKMIIFSSLDDIQHTL